MCRLFRASLDGWSAARDEKGIRNGSGRWIVTEMGPRYRSTSCLKTRKRLLVISVVIVTSSGSTGREALK